MLYSEHEAEGVSRKRGKKMNAEEILIQRIKETSDACQRGEISQDEANRVISIFADALRSVKS